MKLWIRIVVSLAVALAAVGVMLATKGNYASKAQLLGLAMIAAVLGWTLTGMKRS